MLRIFSAGALPALLLMAFLLQPDAACALGRRVPSFKSASGAAIGSKMIAPLELRSVYLRSQIAPFETRATASIFRPQEAASSIFNSSMPPDVELGTAFKSIAPDSKMAFMDGGGTRTEAHATYVVAPDTIGAYSNIFPGKMNAAYLSELATVKLVFENARERARFAKESDGVADFQHFVGKSDAKVVSIIGHNENGLFKFPNGEQAHLAKLAEICQALGRICVFFSCEARVIFREFQIEYGIGAHSKLNYLEAARAASRLGRLLEEKKHLTPQQLMAEISAMTDASLQKQGLAMHLSAVTNMRGRGTAALIVMMDALPCIAQTSPPAYCGRRSHGGRRR